MQSVLDSRWKRVCLVCLLYVGFFATNKKFLEPGLKHFANGTHKEMSTLGLCDLFPLLSPLINQLCRQEEGKRSHFISTDFDRSGSGARGKPVYVPSQKELGTRCSVSVFHLIWDTKWWGTDLAKITSLSHSYSNAVVDLCLSATPRCVFDDSQHCLANKKQYIVIGSAHRLLYFPYTRSSTDVFSLVPGLPLMLWEK